MFTGSGGYGEGGRCLQGEVAGDSTAGASSSSSHRKEAELVRRWHTAKRIGNGGGVNVLGVNHGFQLKIL